MRRLIDKELATLAKHVLTALQAAMARSLRGTDPRKIWILGGLIASRVSTGEPKLELCPFGKLAS